MRSALLVAVCAGALSAGVAHAQTVAAQPPAPAPASPPAAATGATVGPAPAAAAPAAPAVTLNGPSMTPPLSLNATPISVDAGPLGKVYISGQITGLGLLQTNRTPDPLPGAGNSKNLADLSNGQVEIQTVSGPLQIFIEAGAYSFPSLGTGYIHVGKNTDNYFGAVPVAYAKLALPAGFSVQGGSLPTLIGSEYAFTFQNMNIERGLLWNQEPVISKGVQLNYAHGPFTVSASVNDGYDSDHYNWFSGLASYAINGENTIAVNGGFNMGTTYTTKFRAPNTLSNSGILDVAYTFTKGPLLINPYFQYTTVDADPGAGVYTSAKTYSGAVLAKYSFTPQFSLAARGEYVSSSSRGCPVDDLVCAPTNLLYGPSSDAWSVTLTPTYQVGVLFLRGEVSYTRIENPTGGYGFGDDFNAHDQFRGLIETGILF